MLHCPSSGVFPTRVGVFPDGSPVSTGTDCLPHTRGGVSLESGYTRLADGLPHTRGGVSRSRKNRRSIHLSSPHAWGCFFHWHGNCMYRSVFPTRVGVFPTREGSEYILSSLPHTRGGVSIGKSVPTRREMSSPHAWGCFFALPSDSEEHLVFPTRVGVFLHFHLIW